MYMGDAFSEQRKIKEREDNYKEFLSNLKEYLSQGGNKNYEKLWESAKATNIRNAFSRFGENYGLDYKDMPKKYKEFFDKNLKKLLDNDERTWGRLLESAMDVFEFKNHYKQLKEFSPYANKILVKVDYGSGHARRPQIKGEIQEFFDDIIQNQGDYMVYDGDNYFLAMDYDSLGKSLDKIVWLSPGTSTAKHSPRDKDGNIKEE